MTRWSLPLCLGLTVLSAVAPAAQASEVPQALASHLRMRGAGAVSLVHRSFLFEGAAEAVAQMTTQAGCIGFLVIGGGQVRDVDVSLYTSGGLALDEDVGPAPYGYVRACVDASVPLVVGTSLHAGRGELSLLRVEHAPRELGRLPASIELALSQGGRTEEPQPLDTPAEEDGIATLLMSEEDRLFERGYVATGAPEVLPLSGGEGQTQLVFSGGHCVRILAHVPGVRGVSLQLEDQRGASVIVRSPQRDAVELAFCPIDASSHRLLARARATRALMVFRVFEHPLAPASEADAELALGAAEVRHEWDKRGFAMIPLGDAWVEPREPSRFSVDLSAGQCYSLAAVSAEASPLDLRLVDPGGRLVSRTEGRNGVPIVYACPEQTGRHSLQLFSRGRQQRASVWLSRAQMQAGESP